MIHGALLFSVLAGALAVHWMDLANPRRVKLVTAFTGAYLMALTCLHLLPEVFGNGHHGHHHGHHTHEQPQAILLGACVLAGFFFQVILDNFSEGIEHGHAHLHHSGTTTMMIGLCFHAFLEAMPLQHAHDSQLLLGIVIHKFPVSIILLGMLLHQSTNRKRAYGLLGVFAIMAPLGALVGNLPALKNHAAILLAVVIGIFMHVSTTILFETGEDHHYNRRKGLAILLGAVLAALGVFLMPAHAH